MTILSVNDIVASAKVRRALRKVLTTTVGATYSAWTLASLPAAGSTPATGGGAVPTNATPGALVFSNPTAPVKTYLGRLAFNANGPGVLTIADRLVHTSGLRGNLNTLQSINTTALTRETSGLDVEAALEWYGATGITAVTATVGYTNEQGTGSRSGSASLAASMAASRFLPITLQAGDGGVRSVQDLTLSATTGTQGNIGVTLFRRLLELPLAANNVGAAVDAISSGLLEVVDDACLFFLWQASGSIAAELVGSVTLLQG